MKHTLVQATLQALTYHYTSIHQLASHEVEVAINTTSSELTSYFEQDAQDLVHAWVHRASDFEFMESSVAPKEFDRAIELLQVFRDADALYHDLSAHQQQRAERGQSPLPFEMMALAVSEAERALVGDVTACVLERRSLPELYRWISSALVKMRVALNVASEQVHQRYISAPQYTSGDYTQAPSTDEPETSTTCLLQAPCQSALMEDWRGLFDDEWISLGIQEQLELERRAEALRDELDRLWRGERRELLEEPLFNELWSDIIYPYYVDELSVSIKQKRSGDIINDVAQCFIQLIDMKRPKDQRIGSFWVSEANPSDITVIFLTRDGRLLAQRDLTWTPDQPQSALDAFEMINIKTLTYPTSLNQHYPELLNILRQRYQLKAVSAVALDPNQQVPHLSSEAYGALRVGQRYVAPLRYWGRADLIELTRHLIAPQVLQSLERSRHLDQLSQRLQDHCSERWLELRSKRLARQQPRVEQREVLYSRGDLIEVYLVDRDEGSLSVVTLRDERRGYLKLTPKVLKEITRRGKGLNIGDKLTLSVLGEHPAEGTLTLSLPPSEISPRNDQRKYIKSEDMPEDSTLDRLNDLFSKEKRRSAKASSNAPSARSRGDAQHLKRDQQTPSQSAEPQTNNQRRVHVRYRSN